MSQHSLTPLDKLAVGDAGRVARVEGDDAVWLRILEMGLLSGVDVTVVKVAPLGDPLELRVRGHHLSLRRAEAARVWVERMAEEVGT